MEWKPEHLTYFNKANIQTALLKAGFQDVVVQPGWKILSFDYVKAHFEKFPVPFFTPALRMLGSILPSNQAHLALALRKILTTGKRRIGFIGLSFKTGTDDLRESPLVTLAEQLIGKRNTSIKTWPMVTRLRCGSAMPSSALMNRFAASTVCSSMPNAP